MTAPGKPVAPARLVTEKGALAIESSIGGTWTGVGAETGTAPAFLVVGLPSIRHLRGARNVARPRYSYRVASYSCSLAPPAKPLAHHWSIGPFSNCMMRRRIIRYACCKSGYAERLRTTCGCDGDLVRTRCGLGADYV